MMASLSLTAVLVWVVCSSAVLSSILPGPGRGYPYQQSYSSRQTQTYDYNTGAYSSVTVTSRRCSIIRRMTHYESVHVPFLCHVISKRVVPLPRHMDANKVQILNAMQAGGWSMCYKPMTIPLYTYQRIPVCCPGTTPTPDGGCICRKSGSSQTPSLPTPGQLLQSSTKIFNDGQLDSASSYPGYQYIPATPPTTPVVMRASRPYRRLLNRAPQTTFTPKDLIQQLIFSSGSGGPTYSTDNSGGLPSPSSSRQSGSSPTVTDWHSDIARYLAAMMYQKLLVEQQQKILQDEINRQMRLRQQMEFIIAQQRRLAQQLQQQQHQQQRNPPYPVPQPPPTNTDPRPAPSPPVMTVTTSAPEAEPVGESTLAPEVLLHQEQQQQQEEGEGQPGEDGQMWSEGILEKMPPTNDPSSTDRPPVNGNGPASFPQGTHSLPPQLLEMKEKVKRIVDDCLAKSGIASPMEDILQSGDIDQLRPVCSASDTVGPCVMEAAQAGLGQDQLGMVGRQMMQSVLMSLGQLCVRLQRSDQTTGQNKGEITSPPVFPNPAPSMTEEVVTLGTAETTKAESPALTPKDTSDADSQPALTPIAVEEKAIVTSLKKPVEEEGPSSQILDATDMPLDPAATPNAHVQEDKDLGETAAVAAFPLWMILAMVGACAALLLLGCLTVCLLLRCRRKKKTVGLEREPEKLPVPAAEANIYAASPCVPPPAYVTTAVKQSMGGEEEQEKGEVKMDDKEFKIPEDEGCKTATDGAAEGATAPEKEEE